MSYEAIKFIHVLVLVFWLGTDVGVLLLARKFRDASLSVETRLTLLHMAMVIDTLPRICFIVMLPVGVHLGNAAGLLDVFNPLLISEEVGVQKPDKRIFEMALTHLGLGPEALLYVGDSISHDREGCLRAGIDFWHYCPRMDVDNELPAVPYRLTELTDLPIMLARLG